jgi:SAM-dependent methyltransferase
VYDVVIANSVFEHVEYWRKGLTAIHRALKPGGVMFFESTNKWSITSGEVPWMPCYGFMPNWLRYGFRKVVHGRDIMQNGIDFHQFTYRGLRRAFREIGFSKFHDRVALVDPSQVQSPLKRSVLQICKSNVVVRSTVLTFFETTTFVCVK